MKNRIALFLILSCAFACAQQAAPPPAWIQTSNQDAKILLDVMAHFNPEPAARSGVEGVDENVIDLGPQVEERHRQALAAAEAQLKQKLASETDPNVREDLQILIHSAEQNIHGIDLDQKY